MTDVRVLTVNLWHVNQPLDLRMQRLAAYLRAERFDVVALQEVSDYRGTSQADYLAGETGYVAATDWAGSGAERGEGLAVLSRHPTGERLRHQLPDVPGDSGRILQRVTIAVAGRTVTVANTHLAHSLDARSGRVEQARRISQRLPAADGPTVLCGDLNDTPRSPPLRVLTGPPLRLIDTLPADDDPDRHTLTAANPWMAEDKPNRRVDYILHSRQLSPVDAAVVLKRADRIVSDHYGVAATLRLP